MKPKNKVQSSKFKVQDRKPKFKDQKPKIEDQRPRFEDRRPNFENKNPQSAIRNPQSNLIFGVLPVLEALRANPKRVEKILIADGAREKRLSEIFDLAKQNRVIIQRTARENLSKYAVENSNHQGVIAFAASAEYTDADALLEEIFLKENPLVLILDGVEDPRNLGAILRVAECSGIDGTFIPERRAVGLTETVAKSSAGATEYVKIAKVANLNRLIEELKENNIWVVGTSAEAEMSYTDWDWTQKTALVLGGEGKGLHRLVAENCDALVKIPMQGKIDSLNVSVASGVILFEANRQRRN
jgi:23S rRNA (guanosine2251-2'-O)-methyltransferase